jgi:hypothetical protein
MLLFRSEEHVERWCRTWRMDRGATLSLEQVWALACAWFAPDRRAPEWRRYTVGEGTAIFENLGLTTAYWKI